MRKMRIKLGAYRLVKRTAEQRDKIEKPSSTPGYYVHQAIRITDSEVDHLGIASATIEWTPENYDKFKTMKDKPKKKAGGGYKIEPIAGYDDQTGKYYRVTKVNSKGTVTAVRPIISENAGTTANARTYRVTKVKLIKPRKRIKARSDSLRARALRELYEETKKSFLAYRRSCERCGKERPLEVHHVRGRTGTLLIDRRFFNGLCTYCHNTVHIAVRQAQEEGFMAKTGQWDCPPRDSESARLNGLVLDRIKAIEERIKKRLAKKMEGK